MFTIGFKPYAYVGDTITCDVDGFTATATIYRDDTSDMPDQRDDGFWPSRDPKAAGYVLPENFEAEHAKAERVMAAWKNDEWFFCGVAVTVAKNDVQLTEEYGFALWGVDCNYPDSDNAYLLEVANQLLSESLDKARETLRKLCNPLVASLASYVSGDDGNLPRRDFLFAVATRILDDLKIEHGLQ